MIITTNKNIHIQKSEQKITDKQDLMFLVDYLENQKGMFLSSGTEYPGRYSRWETGFFAPPVEITAYFDKVEFKPLDKKGIQLIKIFEQILIDNNSNEYSISSQNGILTAKINFSNEFFSEENRSKQPTILTPIRVLLSYFKNDTKDALGFYGAFGFDLLFQFEKIKFINKRNPTQPIVRLFFPNRIYIFDRKKEEFSLYEYDFTYKDISTKNIPFENINYKPVKNTELKIDSEIKSTLTDDEYSSLVEKAKQHMMVGDVFELVLRRRYYASYNSSVSGLFKKMININPSPYQFLCQFGDEQLIGTSPEMFIRVTKNKVESCPISGTIKRGSNPIEDEKRIKQLLNSQKDEVELTMCTDVDRNDKSRVCKPGTIKLLGRRQIEKYKGLFHTVDHVEGTLRDDCCGIDAFLSHMWAVTLMGSPKSTAMNLIEKYENESRGYYGGSIGVLFCNGNINTGITIRTIHLKDNIANYSVGASLVYDSVGFDEAQETKIKATSFFNIFQPNKVEVKAESEKMYDDKVKIIVIDNEDSFVNTLSDYFRQTGANVITYRHGISVKQILNNNPTLVMHSPGPKLPKDFKMHELIKQLTDNNVPQFGVCLGLQGIVETFGGKLKKLDIPHQGKKWNITHNQKDIFNNLTSPQLVGAYHSWIADKDGFPECLEITAQNEFNQIMAIKHKTKPIWAVQFHPESIMSTDDDFGIKLIQNVIQLAYESKNK